jgi:hypothetical protein
MGNNDLSKLLETKNPKEQAARVQTLIQAAQAPVVDLIIRFDGRTGQIAIKTIGPDIPAAAVYKLLDAARDALRDAELRSLQGQATSEPAPEEPELSTPKAE